MAIDLVNAVGEVIRFRVCPREVCVVEHEHVRQSPPQ